MHSSYKFHEIPALTFLPALILCIQADRIPMALRASRVLFVCLGIEAQLFVSLLDIEAVG